MRNTMKDNLQGALENLSSAFEEIMISIGTALLPAVKVLTGWLQKLANWFNSLSKTTKSTIAIIAAIAAEIGRASCRERENIAVGDATVKEKKTETRDKGNRK